MATLRDKLSIANQTITNLRVKLAHSEEMMKATLLSSVEEKYNFAKRLEKAESDIRLLSLSLSAPPKENT